MADVEAIKCVSQLDGYIVIRYQVFMSNLILFFDLTDDQLGVTIGFEICYPILLSELETNEHGNVFSHIIGIEFR